MFKILDKSLKETWFNRNYMFDLEGIKIKVKKTNLEQEKQAWQDYNSTA
jgi:hypothetical protein